MTAPHWARPSHHELPQEKWRPVPEFEDRYQVSDLGRVRHVRRGHVLKPHVDRRGYPLVSFYVSPEKTVKRKVHRLVCAAFHGPAPSSEHIVRHLNDDPLDNRAANLAWGTHSDNSYDAIRNGRHPRASQPTCKRGHEYPPLEVAHDRGTRRCRTCAYAAARRKYAEKKASQAA